MEEAAEVGVRKKKNGERVQGKDGGSGTSPKTVDVDGSRKV